VIQRLYGTIGTVSFKERFWVLFLTLFFFLGSPGSAHPIQDRPRLPLSNLRGDSVDPTDKFFPGKFSGADLPAGTLVLTVDDGPSNRVEEFIDFVNGEQIPTTFFLIGKEIEEKENPGATLKRMKDSGHLVANHSYTHPHFPSLADPTEEVSKTDALLLPYITNQIFLFRAPYGDWDPRLPDILNTGKMKKYLGPIDWDIDGRDWECWSQGQLSPEQCGERYLSKTLEARRGVILTHDHGGPRGKTIEMLRWLVPRLKAQGFRFVRLDKVPSIYKEMSIEK
jgi:peptidoglycan-N-acetylglucosamine deacetylase